MERYSVITQKNKREIVLLRGKGCAYAKCAFCDYHLDRNGDDELNFELNRSVLKRVTGKYGNLEVINSGSVFELDANTLELIRKICLEKNVFVLHFESHWLYRDLIPALREYFDGIALKMKLGLETFDYDLREKVLLKGIPEKDPAKIVGGFDEANFLFGIKGQTVESMRYDVAEGLKRFERICVNLMCKNSTRVLPDGKIISDFMKYLYPELVADERVDVLINNTDFGVGD